jgi:hypothetical protein
MRSTSGPASFLSSPATFPIRNTVRYTILMAIMMALPHWMNAQAVQSPCPPIGADTTCGVVLTVIDIGTGKTPCPPGGCVVLSTNTGQPPYDDIEDTLIGVVNSSQVPISSMVLTSLQGLPAFGFDGDGICGLSPNTGLPYVPGVACTWPHPTTYEGPVMNAAGQIIGSVSFSNYSSLTTGTVTFSPAIPARGGTAYFSLEESLASATACTDIVNNALTNPPSIINYGTEITATFTPNLGYSLASAAQACGFADFDWVQTFTHISDPGNMWARNSGGAFNPAISGPVRLTSAYSGKVSDPPQGGGYSNPNPVLAAHYMVDNSYPFYCNVAGDPDCTKTASSISWRDQPLDTCFVNAQGTPSYSYLNSAAIRANCQNKTGYPSSFKLNTAPIGSYTGFTTHLAGVTYPNGPGTAPVAVDLGIGYTWKSNYNGSAGGIFDASKGPIQTVDPATAYGGVTVVNVSETTNYQYPKGISVTGINGVSIPTTPPSTTLLTSVVAASSGFAYSRVTGTFDGTVTITNKGTSTVSGPFQIVFDALTSGVTLTNAISTLGGWPYVTVPNVSSLAPGQSASVEVMFQNPSDLAIEVDPVVYSGSFN